MQLKELMTTSEIVLVTRHVISFKLWIFTLTKPVFGGRQVSPLIEDHIEDYHDTNHDVEGNQSCHGGEVAVVVNNHEDEEDENSGHNIHKHPQQQDYDVQ